MKLPSYAFSLYGASWYYLVNPTQNWVIDWIMNWCENFMMPILFFISGYFAVPSFLKHGIKETMKNKIEKLLVPLIFGAVFVVPPFHYSWNFRLGNSYPVSFPSYWLSKNLDALHLRAVFISCISW
jgi:fucose 4-O-acetylase-like acetyltransferase